MKPIGPERADLAFIDRVAIVTGASSGIGVATARELGQRGATVVLAARRAAELERQAQVMRTAGDRAVAIPADVTDTRQVRSLVDGTIAKFGRLDIVVNNAGANWHRPVASTPPAELARLVELNLIAPMLLTRAALPEMLARHDGSIVFVGSLSGRVAMEPIYSATKYGLRGFALALRRQLAGTGVSVSLVSPGNIRTEMTRHVTARLPGPELVAEQIADLIVRPRREVVIPRRHYIIAWLEQLAGSAIDLVHRWRRWGGVTEEEPTAWIF
jgi:NAD(P)-dependent dehydrogenase (short-subunit alcohol dehydrogenase family)